MGNRDEEMRKNVECRDRSIVRQPECRKEAAEIDLVKEAKARR